MLFLKRAFVPLFLIALTACSGGSRTPGSNILPATQQASISSPHTRTPQSLLSTLLFVPIWGTGVSGHLAVYSNGYNGGGSPACTISSSAFPNPRVVAFSWTDGNMYVFDANKTVSAIPSNVCAPLSGQAMNITPSKTFAVPFNVTSMALASTGQLVMTDGVNGAHLYSTTTGTEQAFISFPSATEVTTDVYSADMLISDGSSLISEYNFANGGPTVVCANIDTTEFLAVPDSNPYDSPVSAPFKIAFGRQGEFLIASYFKYNHKGGYFGELQSVQDPILAPNKCLLYGITAITTTPGSTTNTMLYKTPGIAYDWEHDQIGVSSATGNLTSYAIGIEVWTNAALDQDSQTPSMAYGNNGFVTSNPPTGFAYAPI